MLDGFDQRHREVPRAVQDHEAKRGHHDHLADAGLVAVPEQDRPDQQARGQDRGQQRMHQAQLLEVAQRAAAPVHLALHALAEAPALAMGRPEGSYERHVVDDVEQLAIHPRRLGGVAVMQRPATGGKPEHQPRQQPGEDHQHAGHQRAHDDHQQDREADIQAGRQHVPEGQVLKREHRRRGRRDAARQGARHAVGEIRWRVAGQVPEQVPPEVAGDRHEGVGRDPAADAPRHVVEGDQAAQQPYGPPDRPHLAVLVRVQGVDQEVDRVRRADCATHRQDYRQHDADVLHLVAPDIAEHEGERLARQAHQVGIRDCRRMIDGGGHAAVPQAHPSDLPALMNGRISCCSSRAANGCNPLPCVRAACDGAATRDGGEPRQRVPDATRIVPESYYTDTPDRN